MSPVVPGCWSYGGSECPARGFLSPLSPLPSSRRLVTLARGLAPAFLRFAGKRTDFLQFHNVKNPAKSRGGPGPDYYLKNYEDGEPRGRRGGRALQRGLREPGGPAPPAPLSLRPAGPCRARARCRRAPGRAQFPYPFFPREGSRGARRSSLPPLSVDSAGVGPREQKTSTGERNFSYSPAPLSPPSPFAPEPRAGSGGRRGDFAAAPGGARHRSPGMPVHAPSRAAPAALGSLSPRTSPLCAFPCPPLPLGLPAAPPALVTVGPRVLMPGRGCSPSEPFGHPSSFQSHHLAPAFPLLPSSPSALLPIGPQYTKGFHLSRPIIHTKELCRKVRAISPPEAFLLRSRIPCPHGRIY